jgi:FixJ family two-component response regulator
MSEAGDSRLNFNRAFVIDDDVSVQQFVANTLSGKGLHIESFSTAQPALAALGAGHPALIFLDVALLHSDAIDVLIGLGQEEYSGVVILMSAGRPQLVEAVQRLGIRHGLKLAPPLGKPVEDKDILQALTSVKPLIDAPPPRRVTAKA